jgi:multiple sugar transport system ATP-binding protein
MNLCEIACGSNGSRSLPFGGATVELPPALAGTGWNRVVLGLRPESLELAGDGLPARVLVVEEIGADAYVFCVAEIGGEDVKLVARCEARQTPARDERVHLRPRAHEAHLFHPESGERISG